MRLLKKTNIDFVGKYKLAGIFSVVVIVIGLSSIVMKGGLNLSIDFTGPREIVPMHIIQNMHIQGPCFSPTIF